MVHQRKLEAARELLLGWKPEGHGPARSARRVGETGPFCRVQTWTTTRQVAPSYYEP